MVGGLVEQQGAVVGEEDTREFDPPALDAGQLAERLVHEPATHLHADSVGWPRGVLTAHQGGLVLISHDLDLLEHTVNRVFHLDPQRAAV
ncbi:hypothetical protein VM98_38160, partial [Streptomyces rubellomurinus subsp. indigoferus]